MLFAVTTQFDVYFRILRIYSINNFDSQTYNNILFVFFTSDRHILAALHFNYNLHREGKVNPDGSVPLKVSYPKFKNGEATIINQKIAQKFGNYHTCYAIMLSAQHFLKLF